MIKHEENHEVTLKFKDRSTMDSAIKNLKQNGFDFKISGLSDYDFIFWKEENNDKQWRSE